MSYVYIAYKHRLYQRSIVLGPFEVDLLSFWIFSPSTFFFLPSPSVVNWSVSSFLAAASGEEVELALNWFFLFFLGPFSCHFFRKTPPRDSFWRCFVSLKVFLRVCQGKSNLVWYWLKLIWEVLFEFFFKGFLGKFDIRLIRLLKGQHSRT